jgi:hypothetical protein
MAIEFVHISHNIKISGQVADQHSAAWDGPLPIIQFRLENPWTLFGVNFPCPQLVLVLNRKHALDLKDETRLIECDE